MTSSVSLKILLTITEVEQYKTSLVDFKLSRYLKSTYVRCIKLYNKHFKNKTPYVMMCQHRKSKFQIMITKNECNDLNIKGHFDNAIRMAGYPIDL